MREVRSEYLFADQGQIHGGQRGITADQRNYERRAQAGNEKFPPRLIW